MNEADGLIFVFVGLHAEAEAVVAGDHFGNGYAVPLDGEECLGPMLGYLNKLAWTWQVPLHTF